MKIFGAGMAGLIAGHIFRNQQPTIYEAQESLPNNHNALLRFRSPIVSVETGIPFKKVKVYKNVFYEGKMYDRTTIKLANLYSQKVSDSITGRSIWNLDQVERYIAPPDFISQLARGLDIKYDCKLDADWALQRYNRVQNKDDPRYAGSKVEPVISTIPMPTLANACNWTDMSSVFQKKSIWSMSGDIVDYPVDVYQTVYYPGKENNYRASITGNHVILEFLDDPSVAVEQAQSYISMFLVHLGINIPLSSIANCKLKKQKFGKIVNKDIDLTRGFVLSMTEDYEIYSLGRFATWRQLLLDDMAKDCNVINRLITTRDSYESKLNR